MNIEEDKQFPLSLGRPFLATGAALIDVKKGELTLRVGDKAVHFHMNQILKKIYDDNANCNSVEQLVSISTMIVKFRIQ